LEQAQACLRLAQLTVKLGSMERALALFEEAIGRLKALKQGDHRLQIAAAYGLVANLHSQTRRLTEAEKNYREAIKIEEEVRLEEPRNETCLFNLAHSWNDLGLLLNNTDRTGEAEEAYGKALELKRSLAEGHPGNLEHQRSLAMTLTNLADLYHAAG